MREWIALLIFAGGSIISIGLAGCAESRSTGELASLRHAYMNTIKERDFYKAQAERAQAPLAVATRKAYTDGVKFGAASVKCSPKWDPVK